MELFYITTIILILLAIFLSMGQFIRSKIVQVKKLREELKSISDFAGNYFCEHQILQFQVSSYRSDIEKLKLDKEILEIQLKSSEEARNECIAQNIKMGNQIDSYKKEIEDLKKELENVRNMPQGFIYTSYWPV